DRKGIGYALDKLGDLPHPYDDIDIGHHGWLGGDDTFGPAADLCLEAATSNRATVDDVHGFISNTANYGALEEPYFDIDDVVGGQPIREVAGGWIDWNNFIDEVSFVQAYREEPSSKGFNRDIGMLIDN